MAANYTHNPPSPGRPRPLISGTNNGGAILHFHPRPSKKVHVERLSEAFKVLDLPDAEQQLKGILPIAFCREAKNRGFTLVECVEEAKNLLRVSEGSPGWLMTDEQLAGFLATLAPEMEPYLALVHLRLLLRDRGGHAVKILRRGYYKLRGHSESIHGQIQQGSQNSQPGLP